MVPEPSLQRAPHEADLGDGQPQPLLPRPGGGAPPAAAGAAAAAASARRRPLRDGGRRWLGAARHEHAANGRHRCLSIHDRHQHAHAHHAATCKYE